MRWINRAIAVAAVLTFSAITAWAQDQACTEDYLNETYTKWYEPYKLRDTDQKQKDLAYQIAKEYVDKCPNEFPDNPYAKALKSYKKVYEDAQAKGQLATAFETAVKSKNYADQIKLGKQLVAMPSNADNAAIYLLMGQAGLGDPNQLAESAQAAKKAIELVEGGKPFAPYTNKDQALAAMNYVIAKSLMKTPTDAIPYFVKALRYESDLKKSPVVYNELATAYGEGPVDKFTKDYATLVQQQKSVDSPEVKLVVANLNQAIDGQIDAFARAAAVSTNGADKKAIMDVLAAVYKDRNHADATPEQLNTLVASALSKPVPDAPKVITELPASSPTSGGTSATGTNGSGNGSTTTGTGSGSTGGAKPTAPTTTGSGRPAASGSTTPAKPTPTPKPRQRANHRG
jgi:tetratricopeptide (TPR) repeat protein